MADRITELSLEAVMGERFGRYSKYIIQERALPDIRDGLKPVQRRILFAMDQDGNTYDHPYRKSAKSVGNKSADIGSETKLVIQKKCEYENLR